MPGARHRLSRAAAALAASGRNAPLAAAVLFGIALSLPATGIAQTAVGHGIAGFWSLSFGGVPPRRNPTPVEAELMAFFSDDAIVLGDAGAVEFPPGDYGGLPVLEHLREAAKDYDPAVQTTVATTCRPPGVIYSMQGPFPIEIFEGRDLVVIKLEYFDLVRVVFMNETAHPDDWPHSQTGHSIGRWDGDTLVVDTVALQAGTLFNNGVDYSENVHLVERFRLANPNTLVVTQEFRDAASFEGAAARVLSFNRGDDHVYPYDCDPSYGLALDSVSRPASYSNQ